MRLDVQMLTVHASGGVDMLKAAEQSAQETAWELGHAPPLVLGVTVLTSLDSQALSQIGLDPNVGRQVRRLANMATQAGLRGLVCSPLEVAELRQMLTAGVQLVTPGVRPEAQSRRRPKAHAQSARSHCRRGQLAGDWPAHLRRARPARRGGENSGIAGASQASGLTSGSEFEGRREIYPALNRVSR